MKKVTIVILVAIVLVAVTAVAYSFFREPEAASGPIEAIPLATSTVQATATESVVAVTQEAAPSAEPETQDEIEAPTESAQSSAEVSAPAGTTPAIFEIVAAESEARFLIDEVLRGDPVTVVGSTNQVAGQIAVDPGDLTAAQVGTIQVNVRTLATDNEFRNRAIKNRILRTDDHEFVTFVPQDIEGLLRTGTIGETYTFQIVGDLTIAGVTQQVTFEVTVTPVSETRLEGLATTAFLYTDFELSIPDSPSVDTVEDEVRLEFAFVAEVVQ